MDSAARDLREMLSLDCRGASPLPTAGGCIGGPRVPNTPSLSASGCIVGVARTIIHVTLLLTLGWAAPAFAESVEADLGDGLRYHRAHALPQDLPAEASKLRGLILDLRYVKADEAGATALQAWLRFRTSANHPILVLVNGETSPGLRSMLAATRTQSGLLTIGPAHSGYSPDVAIDVTAEAERRAYNALELGASISTLLTENVSKPRTDEASVAREHANGVKPDGDAAPADDFDAGDTRTDAGDTRTDAGDTRTDAVVEEPAPLDATLQRAVHVYRALRALKRV